MVTVHFLLGDERHGGVILVEIVRHRNDRLLDGGLVRAVLRDDVDLPAVLLPRDELRHFTAAHGIQRLGDGHGVLPRVGNAFDAAHRIGVPLTDAAAPECVVPALGEDDGGVEPVQREHARVPAAGDQCDVTALFRGGVDIREMFRDAGVGVEAVYDIEASGERRRYLRQVGGAAAAEDQHVDLIPITVDVRRSADRRAGLRFNVCGIAAREYANQLRVGVLRDGALNAAPDVSVAVDCEFHTKSNLSITIKKPSKTRSWNSCHRVRLAFPAKTPPPPARPRQTARGCAPRA